MWQALADEEHTLTCEDLSVGLRKLVYNPPPPTQFTAL
jgi:hypothetical protein